MKLLLLIVFLAFSSSVKAISFEEDVTLTHPQKEALESFKKLVINQMTHDYQKEDLFLLKWLRYHNFDVNLARRKLLNHIKWREENKMDTINEEDWSDMVKEFPHSLEGRDKLGRSFLYLEAGGIDLRRSLVHGKGQRLMRYVDKVLQDACTLVRDLGHLHKNITRGHLILNLAGFSMQQHGCFQCLPFLFRIVVSYEEHYPECQDLIIVVNTPNSVEPIVNALKPLLSPGMRKSLHIYGRNKKVWLQALSENFNFAELPPALGGSKVFKGMADYYDDYDDEKDFILLNDN